MSRVEPNRNVYIGHRYVPLVVGEWDKSIQYEGLSIVTFKGASYTSKKMTPPGIDIENNEYWVLTGNYNAQVEYYRLETERVADDLDQAKIDLNKRIDDTVEYVDDETASARQYVDDETASSRQYVDTNVEDLTIYVNDEVRETKEYVDTELYNYKQDTDLTIQNLNDELDETARNFKSTRNKESAVLGNELVDSTGWTSTGWTGNFDSGFSHIVGETTPLIRSIGNTGTNSYVVEFTIESPTSDYDVDVTIGDSVPYQLYTGVGQSIDYSIAIQSINDGDLLFTPKSTFDGTIKNISVKQLVDSYAPTTVIKDSDGNNSLEIRNNKHDLSNIFVGKESGKNNISGFQNVSLGHNSLEKNISGFWNVALGQNTLQENIGGSRNVAIGLNALFENISGQRNVAIGSWSLRTNKTGNRNISIGSDNMFLNKDGSGNVSIGMQAMYYNTIGNTNTSLGDSSLYKNTEGNNNVGIGSLSSRSNETGSNNVSVGNSSLRYNVEGSGNVAVGQNALFNTESSDNVGVGRLVSYNQKTGQYNVAMGTMALQRNVDGQGNVCLGHEAGKGVTGASITRNVVIGLQAGFGLDTGADNNILIGYRSGRHIETGSDNVLIGYNVQTPTPDTSGYLNIGNVITANADGDLNIGNVLHGDTSNDLFGIAESTPTARLHLRAGNLNYAPLKLNSGNLTSEAQAGAIEFDGNSLYFTDDTGTRKELAVVV